MNLFPTLACKSCGHLGAHCSLLWLVRALVVWGLIAPGGSFLTLGAFLWHRFTDQCSAHISGGPLCDLVFSLCSPTHFAVLPCSFRPRCHPWAGISVAVTQKDHSVLSSLSLTSPGNCSGQETRFICCPSLSLLNHSQGAVLPMVQCLRRVSYLSVFFFFLSCLKQEVNLVHCGCKQKSVFTFESEFQGFVLPKKDYILLILEGGTFLKSPPYCVRVRTVLFIF